MSDRRLLKNGSPAEEKYKMRRKSPLTTEQTLATQSTCPNGLPPPKEISRITQTIPPSVKTRNDAERKTLATVDFDSFEDVDVFHIQELTAAGERIHAAVQKNRDAGIIDAHGKRISKKVPPDMRSGSRCQLPE